MSFRAVLFDVGGPIDVEVRHEQHVEVVFERAI